MSKEGQLESLTKMLISIAANQMAIQKVLYDSAITNEAKFQDILQWAEQKAAADPRIQQMLDVARLTDTTKDLSDN